VKAPLLASLFWALACGTDDRTVSTIESNCPGAGCDDADRAARACVPGSTQTCVGGNLCTGAQVCTEDGQRFGACVCPDAGGASPAVATSPAGSGSEGGANGGSAGMLTIDPPPAGGGPQATGSSSGDAGSAVPVVSFIVGGPCNEDLDCGAPPLFCILATSNVEFQVGGPQGGYCSARCATTTECVALDDLSACNTDLGLCMSLCIPGPGEAKCGDRAQACQPIDAEGLGACAPRCTSDAACGVGRFCDPGALGVCTDRAYAGGAVGTPCSVATETTDCASGICLEYTDPRFPGSVAGSFCSATCTLGSPNGCGLDDLSGGTRRAACFQAQAADGVPGDLGYCTPLCDRDQDCAQADEGWVCSLFNDTQTERDVGRLGECFPAVVAAAQG